MLTTLNVFAAAAWADDGGYDEELIVSAQSLSARLDGAGSLSIVDGDALDLARANHVHEAMVRVPGVWISRGSGQEHLTAIRSAVLTGAGACGAFLFLENGVPIRPAGFCNVNNLFEINTEQAAAIEVYKGPASAALGGNALRGAINVVTADPAPGARFSVEAGPDGYRQLRASGGAELDTMRVGAAIHTTTSDGYRDDTGYDQHKFSVVLNTSVAGWAVRNTFTATLLDQQTGGFVVGDEAYDDSALRDTNPNPEAFREAWSLRAASQWLKETGDGQWQLTPYVRRSEMRFLQHFLPGQPLERNKQTSGGVLVRYGEERDALSWSVGGQLEVMTGELTEVQDGPTVGSAFLVATRPEGVHYDYEVDALLAAVDGDLRARLRPGLRLVGGVRLEHVDYDYNNNTLVGNTRDDGTPCGFGGCLYTRPADRSDDFDNAAGRLGLELDLAETIMGHALLATGFRAPQTTELYRLQNGQLVSDIDSERLTSFELGVRTPGLTIAAYVQRVRNLIFRDAEGFNVDNGRTRSEGVELEAFVTRGRHDLDLALTYGRHRYDFDRDVNGGEPIRDGNDVDTAPRWQGSARWRYRPVEQLLSELEVVYLDEYFADGANTLKYDGHTVLNWRGRYALNERTRVFARVLNVLDRNYADRADLAFGNERYFPALPRQVYAGLEIDLGTR